MFTANVAGTAGSHLRSDVPHRDSNSHSRPNLHEIDRDSLANMDEEKRHLRSQHDGGDPENQRRSGRLKWICNNYKTWGYMLCLGTIVIGGIVIIILAATGVISATNES